MLNIQIFGCHLKPFSTYTYITENNLHLFGPDNGDDTVATSLFLEFYLLVTIYQNIISMYPVNNSSDIISK